MTRHPRLADFLIPRKMSETPGEGAGPTRAVVIVGRVPPPGALGLSYFPAASDDLYTLAPDYGREGSGPDASGYTLHGLLLSHLHRICSKSPAPYQIVQSAQSKTDTFGSRLSVAGPCQVASQPGDQPVGLSQGKPRGLLWFEVFFTAASNTSSSSSVYNTVAGSCGNTRPSFTQAKTPPSHDQIEGQHAF